MRECQDFFNNGIFNTSLIFLFQILVLYIIILLRYCIPLKDRSLGLLLGNLFFHLSLVRFKILMFSVESSIGLHNAIHYLKNISADLDMSECYQQ